MNYMEAPILLRVGVPEVGAGPFDLSFLAGPTIGYLTIPTITFSNPSLTQVGFAAGPEISVPAGAARLSLSLRYRTGITSTFEDITARNRGLSGTLGISF